MLHFQNTYADLSSNVYACAIDRKFPAGTSFVRLERKGRLYWYASMPGKQNRYLGRDTPALRKIIDDARDTAFLDKENAMILKSLKSAGIPEPGKEIGRVLEDLSWNGFFRLRGVLVGTLAFQVYHAMLGLNTSMLTKEGLRAAGMEDNAVRKISSLASARTKDIDLAQFKSISVAIDDHLEDRFEDILNKNGTFEPVPSLFGNAVVPKWRNKRTGLIIDILTPLVSHEENETDFLPAFSTKAMKLKFLDFLIYDEIPAVVLHNAGVPVNVPRMERYAVHKMIISQERVDVEKRQKDILQALILSGYLLANDPVTFKETFEEAVSRGHGWRERLNRLFSANIIPEKMLKELSPILQRKTFCITSPYEEAAEDSPSP